MAVDNYQPPGLNTYGFSNGIPGIVGGSRTPLFEQAVTPKDAGPLQYPTVMETGGGPGNENTPELTADQYATNVANFSAVANRGIPALAASMVPGGGALLAGVNIAGRISEGLPPQGLLGSLSDSVAGLFGVGYGAGAAGRNQPSDPATGFTVNEASARAASANQVDPAGDAWLGGVGGEGLAPQGDSDGLGGGSKPFAAGGLVTPTPPTPMNMGAARPPTGQPGLAGAGGPRPPANLQMVDAKINNLLQTQSPGVQQMQMMLQQAVQSGETTPEHIQQLGQIARVVLQNPAMYPQLVRMAEQKGIIPPGELPPQYNEGIVKIVLMAAQVMAGSPLGQPGTQGQPGGAPIDASQQLASGGVIRGPGTGTSDSISGVNANTGGKVRVSNGEYIIPERVVQIKGKEFFDNLLRKYADVSASEA